MSRYTFAKGVSKTMPGNASPPLWLMLKAGGATQLGGGLQTPEGSAEKPVVVWEQALA